jgi:site-specific DNA-methyltransferase (adenine-specific)
MAHQSDRSTRLQLTTLDVASLAAMPTPDPEVAEVWLFLPPFGRTSAEAQASSAWFDALRRFARELNEHSVVAILTSAQDAAQTWPELGDALRFQLWVAVKLAEPVEREVGQLREHHGALLILTKYRTALRHTKTRVAYTFCPACDKTTKDYGGKKHTYHEYGTLVSDVWRDITHTPGSAAAEIAARLADLFGLDPYRALTVVNLNEARALQPKARKNDGPPAPGRARGRRQESALIAGDSLAQLQKVPSDSIDFCFADPPYNLDKRYDAWDDAIAVTDYLAWCESWLGELARVVKPGCSCAVLNIPLWAIRHFQCLARTLTFQAWITWEGLSLPVRMIMPANYAIVCFSKGPARPLPGLAPRARSVLETQALTTLRENYCSRQSCAGARQGDREAITDLWWDIHRLKHNSRRVDHPCQLPPALMRRLIAVFTAPDELVLDPFNGAGTTSLCAAMLGRRYLGIELSQEYHKLACSRHALLHAGGDPFEKIKGAPKAKNSRVGRIGGIKYRVPKRTLQLEVRRVAASLGRLPTREELKNFGTYPICYYDEYFLSWAEVCAAARTTGMSETRPVPAQSSPARHLLPSTG